MSNKVIELQSVLDEGTEQMARELAAQYERWRIQKMPKEEEWKETRNYIFATDTTTTTNSEVPWNNKTTVPKIAQIRDNLHAQYMDTMFPNDEWVTWVGSDNNSNSREKRETITAYVKNKAIHSGLMKTISDLLYDYIDYGNCFGEVVFVNETHKDAVTGDEEATYIGPKLERISPYDHVFNPAASHYSKSPKFTRYLKSIGELVKDIKTQPELNYNKEAVDKIIERRRSISGYDMEDLNKADGYIADGFGTLSEYLGSNLVEILEFTGDWYNMETDELHENRIITIVDGEFILRNIPNPSWTGSDNKFHVGWRERPDNLWAMGPLDNLVGMQYRLDHLENLKADALDFSIRPPIVKQGDVEPFTWAPGVEIDIPDPDGSVTTLPPNPAAFQVNNELAFILNLMEELPGSPKQAMGIRTPGEKTAFEVQTLENNSGRLFQNKTLKFQTEFLEPVLNAFLEVGRRNLDVSDTIAVMDEDFGIETFLTITKKDITAKGKLRAMGARHFSARAQLMQNLAGIFNSPMAEVVKPHLSGVALTQMLEEVMGLNRFKLFRENVAVAEQQRTQSLMNQAQTTLESQAVTPVEEDLV